MSATSNKLPAFVAGQTPSLMEAELANIVRVVVNAWLAGKVSPNGMGTVTIAENSAIINLGPLDERLNKIEKIQKETKETIKETIKETVTNNTVVKETITKLVTEKVKEVFKQEIGKLRANGVCNEDGSFTITFTYSG